MTILDIDNDELDLRSQRMALNLDIQNDMTFESSPLFRTFGSKRHRQDLPNYEIVLDDNGVLYCNDLIMFHTNDFNKDEDSILYQLVADGVISQIKSPAFRIDRRSSVDSKYLTDCITTEDLKIDGAKTISNITFRIAPVAESAYHTCDEHNANFSWNGRHNCTKAAKFGSSNPIFENCRIQFETNVVYKPIQFHGLQEPSHLKGLKSNCSEIYIHTPVDFPEEIWTLFDNKHVCAVYDGEKGINTEIPIKTMKKAIAVANNMDRYKLKDHILKLKDGAKLGDVLPLENFENLNKFIIGNNNVLLTFMKVGHPLTLPLNYSREPEGLLGTSECVQTQEMMDKMYIQTADGWYVAISKRI